MRNGLASVLVFDRNNNRLGEGHSVRGLHDTGHRNQEGTMSNPSRLSHAVLRSYDVKRLMDWYVEVTEGHVIFEGFGMSFMTYDDEHHRLGIVPIQGEEKRNDPANPGLVHLAFAWPSLPDLVETYARLRDKKIYPRLTIDHGLTFSFYYRDPDENTVELVTDLLSPAEATALMYSPSYQGNPVGLLLDPEDVLAGVREGRITPEGLTADFKATEVDVASQLAECGTLQSMDAAEHAKKFEAQLATHH